MSDPSVFAAAQSLETDMTSHLAQFISLSLDILQPVWMEACMFALAGLCYLVCSGPVMGMLPHGAARAHKEPPPVPCSTKLRASASAAPSCRSAARPNGGHRAQGCKMEAAVTSRGGKGESPPWAPARPHVAQGARDCKAEAAASAQDDKLDAGLGCCDLQKQAEAITSLGKKHHLDKAIALFDRVREDGWSTSTLLYNSIIGACIQCGNLVAARSYFLDMESLGLQDVVSFNTMMRGYATQGNIGEARSLFQKMTSQGIGANLGSYHCLLHAAVKCQDHRGMWQMVKDMQSAQLSPNVVTCSILLQAIIAGGSASPREDLLRVLKLMDAPHLQVDEVLFGTLAEACVRTGSIELLSDWVQRKSILGRIAKLTQATYGSIIKAYGQARDVERIWEFWRHMEARKVDPSPITLGCMVEALVMNHCSEEAWGLVQKALQTDNMRSSVNTITYSTILKGFAMAKRHDKVTELYEEMKSEGVPLNPITYNTILNCIARCGLMHKAADLLQDMRTADPPVEPDVVTYSTLVKGYCLSGDLDKGLFVLQEMRSRTSLAPDEVMYNSLLDGCARQQRLDDALRLLDEMQVVGIAPSNYTMSIVCKLLSRARRLGHALEMVETMSRKYGFRPNIQVYTCLIQSCFHNRQLTKAFGLYDQLVGEGILPDRKTYTALAQGCLQAGVLEKAVQVVRCSYHLPCQGLRPLPGKQEPAGVEDCCFREVLARMGRYFGVSASRALEAEVAKVKQRKGSASGSSHRTPSQ